MKFAIIKSCLARFSGIFAVGTPSNIHGTAISYRCAKFGAFVNSVTILTLRDLTSMTFREKQIAALFNETTLTKVGVVTFNCGHSRGGHNPGGGGESVSDLPPSLPR